MTASTAIAIATSARESSMLDNLKINPTAFNATRTDREATHQIAQAIQLAADTTAGRPLRPIEPETSGRPCLCAF